MLYSICKGCGKMKGITNGRIVFNNCNCNKQIKERKQMEPSDFYRLYEILHHRNCKINCGEQYDYWKKRVTERMLYLTPLINELKQKGIELATLSKELHQEWIELLESKEYYKF